MGFTGRWLGVLLVLVTLAALITYIARLVQNFRHWQKESGQAISPSDGMQPRGGT
jgi:uncharacterized protein with PQ loop repeat